MTLAPAELRRLVALVDRQAATRGRIETTLTTRLLTEWARFDGWYRPDLVDEIAAASAALVQQSRVLVSGSTSAYIAQTLSILRDQAESQSLAALAATRGPTPLAEVYARPAKKYRYEVSQGATAEQASTAALQYVRLAGETDVMLANRLTAQQIYERDPGIGLYRRVIRPERAKTGTCGLCIVAADNRYHSDQLMPIHERCGCETLPVTVDDAPARMNRDELDAIYQAAGGQQADALKNTRVQVNEHGELGPVISRSGDNFRGPYDVARDTDDAALAARLAA